VYIYEKKLLMIFCFFEKKHVLLDAKT
jgi:hypothetical protein